MQPIKLSPFQAFRRSLALVIQAAPIELRYLILLTLISGAGSPIVLFLNKIIIDEASRLLRQGATANPIALMVGCRNRNFWGSKYFPRMGLNFEFCDGNTEKTVKI